MADIFYGASMNIAAARAAINIGDFSHFIFHVSGTGDGSFYLRCNAAYVTGATPTRTYVHQNLLDVKTTPWPNAATNSKIFTFVNMAMDAKLFSQLAPGNVTSTEITILPTGLLLEAHTGYYYLDYQASTIVPGAIKNPVVRSLNPSPPYHPS